MIFDVTPWRCVFVSGSLFEHIIIRFAYAYADCRAGLPAPFAPRARACTAPHLNRIIFYIFLIIKLYIQYSL